MRALITGAGGFVARHLSKHLASHGDSIALCYFSANEFEHNSKSSSCENFLLDVRVWQQTYDIISSYKPDVVYHLAGMAYVPEAEEDFERALSANVLGSFNVAKACSILNRETKLIFISSAEVYGKLNASQLPVVESLPTKPANNYSLTKVMAEQACLRFSSQGVLKVGIVRPFNHTGASQNDRFVVSNFAKQLARIKLKKEAALMHVGNLNAERDFSNVTDIVRGYRMFANFLIENRDRNGEIINLCSGRAISIKSILDRLIVISGVDLNIKEDAARMRAAEVPIFYGSYKKAEELIGWQPEIDIEQTLEEVFEYWLQISK
jgi:GDP-4-dehydro-6-deoxy-D-mannose reductase